MPADIVAAVPGRGERCVAFFRNVNQGQRGHPSTRDLLTAFADAGVADAESFRSNGTVVFDASDPREAVADVRAGLRARGVFAGEVFVRPMSFVEQIVDASSGIPDAARTELTLFPPDEIVAGREDARVEVEAERRRCRVVDGGAGWALVVNDRDAQSNGTPTIEAALGTLATSRGLPTLQRLVERFAAG